mmetsp:Transcript_16890/g.21368  ORF Transcript_16890/g.21368 Transcript_16890/m.21368 type:complete len:267 (-) Transcript_16890:356-1156(-)|eukprot:CAMPEP_0203641414 /NCGR_PEP_ID=MMETSP0088-20131115/6728_1 /ASSEMBLY_ACC=CAM_ASM_001087 /TAXON_ID=426623 /ORGANISM="Chaetoceros affinis, Strain CCMP159" /LENGTH=266 /DNA_ID=CAMNT_0050496849 /DNA_START=142 /DNA_END=945 /DNA_ORIENTATION=+
MQSISECPEYYSSCDNAAEEKTFNLSSFAISFDLHEEGEQRLHQQQHQQELQQQFHSRSPAIPLPESHIHRTESELDLSENIAMAEFRDQCMFNRLVSGIQKQQKLLYDVEVHCPQPSTSTSTSSSSSSSCQEEIENSWNQHRGLHQQHSSLPSCSTDCSSKKEVVDILESSRSTDSYLPLPVPPSYSSKSSTPEVCLEENQRSIENIISTRHSKVNANHNSSDNNSSINDMMFLMTTSASTNVAVSDDEEDENFDDFGQVFDLEL